MRPARPSGGWVPILLAAVCVIHLAAAARFAGVQSIWVDETTQMTGLSLDFIERLRWLAGGSNLQLGVPPDRMPPGSYLLGAAWSVVAGLSESAMRWFGIVALATGLPALYLAGLRLGGAWAGLFALAAAAFSANLVTTAVEIRAYPVFFSVSAWAIYALLRLQSAKSAAQRRIWLTTLTALLLIASYTHFFGLVMAGATWSAVVFTDRVAGRDPRPAIVAIVVFAAGCLGLAPFVLAAFDVGQQVSTASSESTRSAELAGAGRELAVGAARLAYRVFAHPVLESVPITRLVVLGSVGALAVVAVVRAAGNRSSTASHLKSLAASPAAVLAMVLVVGGFIIAAGSLTLSRFDPFAPSYNIWMVPTAILFLASAFGIRRGRIVQAVCQLAGIALVAGNLVGTTQLLRHAVLYTHGPGEWLAERVAAASGTVAVVHDGRGPWGAAYFPLRYNFGDRISQWVVDGDGQASLIRPAGLVKAKSETPWQEADTVIWAQTRNLYAKDLAAVAQGERPCKFASPWNSINPDVWSLGEDFCAFVYLSTVSVAAKIPGKPLAD